MFTLAGVELDTAISASTFLKERLLATLANWQIIEEYDIVE